MDPVTTRSQPDSGVQKNQSNPTIPTNIQAQNVRPQNISNINSKSIERNVQPAPNYQPPQPSQPQTQPQPQPQPLQQQKPPPQQQQQQQQQNYRLPNVGQVNFQQNPQPVIRPPVNPGIRQVINPNQPQLIRNIQPTSNQPIRPPINQNQQQFRPPPPQQQQQFQRPIFDQRPNQTPLEQQQQQPQYRPQAPPVNLQQQHRQPIPEQKVFRNPIPAQNPNMTAEIIRERTFTTSNEGSMDDDDDVVIGRMVTPQTRPTIVSKQADSYDQQRPMSGAKETIQQPLQQQPMQQQQQPMQQHQLPMQPQQQPMQQQQQQQQQRPMPPPMMQRRESVQSIPSRPPSGLGSNNSQSPEPRMNPMPPQNVGPINIQPQQQFQTSRMESNRNIPSEMNRQSPNNYDYGRDSNDYNDRVDKVQRPLGQTNNAPLQRQSPEDHMQRQAPKMNPQPAPAQQQFRPPPQQVPQNEIYSRTNQEPKKFQPEHFTPQQQQQTPTNPSALKMPDQRKSAGETKPVEGQNKKNSVRLDLGRSENMKSANDKSPSKGDNDSGVDENFQEKNGNSPISPLKSPSKIPSYQPRPASITPKTRSRSTSKQRLSLKASPETEQFKKIPMNKVEVGNTPSPNLKKIQSKIGSLDNATHKPGGGNVKIESRKMEIKAAPRIEAKNQAYVSRGGDKKIVSQKLTWNAKSKIGSLDNAGHKPGGGDKRIMEVKTDFKERAKPKVGSKDNMTYQPGGGDVKIISQKIDFKGESKVGSMDNVKHRPGGGEKKIFDDKEYLKQIDHPIPLSPQTQSSLQSGDPSTDNLAETDLVNEQF